MDEISKTNNRGRVRKKSSYVSMTLNMKCQHIKNYIGVKFKIGESSYTICGYSNSMNVNNIGICCCVIVFGDVVNKQPNLANMKNVKMFLKDKSKRYSLFAYDVLFKENGDFRYKKMVSQK